MPIFSRSPHGERGLKYKSIPFCVSKTWSLSSWRAWIEIVSCRVLRVTRSGRSPHGERGLKYVLEIARTVCTVGRSPHGERGLKYLVKHVTQHVAQVALLMESVD